MPPQPYDNCPCGSGKKFKWCCTPFFDQIELALDQQQQEQHDGAVRTMQALTATHGDKPQVWGYYAHILFAEGKTDEAETALQTAFQLQPDFAMGHLLRGLFRQAEGEIIGALSLFRKAADAYSPEAVDQLTQVHEMIARNELMLNRPVASRAALERAAFFQPGDAELTGQFEQIFGDESRLPAAARKAYNFRPATRPVPESAATGKLSDAMRAFEALTHAVPDDAAAWFNLGLTKAWLGEQPSAVEALNKSLELEIDDYRAEETAALVEVLKCGQGMEADSDYVEHRVFMPIRDVEAVSGLLQVWDQEGRMLAAQSDPQGTTFTAMIVDELPSLLETGTTLAKVTANLKIAGGYILLWHPVQESVAKIGLEIRDRLNLAVGEPVTGVGPVQFGDVSLEALAYPTRSANPVEAETKMRDYAGRFFDDVWPHHPLKALGGANAIDAVGSKLLRKRLLGVIRFISDCLDGSAPRKQTEQGVVEPIRVYDFDRLRHKLGLTMQAVDAPATVAHVPAVPAAAKRDIAGMSAADLAGLPTAELTAADLEEALRAAIKLDARELAVAFAKAGVAKPVDEAKPDRFPFYACLITGAMSEGQPAAALTAATDGAAYDAAHNGGKRANEFGLRKAAILARTGDAAGSAAEFDAVIDRTPDDGNLYVKAAETMLSIKNGAKAGYFAEKGLAKAKASGNRDLEGACTELAAAAKRFG